MAKAWTPTQAEMMTRIARFRELTSTRWRHAERKGRHAERKGIPAEAPQR